MRHVSHEAVKCESLRLVIIKFHSLNLILIARAFIFNEWNLGTTKIAKLFTLINYGE